MAIEIRDMLQDFGDRKAALEAAQELDETAFGEPVEQDDIESPIYGVVEDDRTFFAWEGDEVIGLCANFTLNTSTPGGELPTAGVTLIAVRPTHRRRGVLRRMLGVLHADGIARNEPIAALWAADAAIYGRFGYGLATQGMKLTVPHTHSTLVDAPHDPSLRLRMVDTSSDFEYVKPVYDHVRGTRGGMLELTEAWNTRHVFDPPRYREGATRAMTVIAEDDNGVRGLVRYSLKAAWPTGRYGEGEVKVQRLLSRDAAAHAALWRYCFSLDLMTTTRHWNLPVDDPVLTWLEHSRQSVREVGDTMWVRILDLPSALAGRTYARDVDVVLEVADRDFEANAGTWRLSAGSEGATCERTSTSPDISLDIRSLGAVLLGGPTLQAHGDASWLTEHTQGSLAAVSAAFEAPRAPHCPFVF
ncbi:MAG TPA: GNAT family N-acetyltransferase [Actinomycetes bacterium]|nr:GNAT family N-acetyltransferase [Actinomycetes bacterium]